MNFSDTLKFVEKYNFAYAEFSKSILILSVSVLVLWGYKKSKHYLFSVVPILCLVIDLFNFGINLNPLIPASILKEKSKFARILEKDTELFRVIIAPSAFSDFNSQHFHPFLNEKIEDITPLTDAKTLIFPNLNIPFKIQHFNGYDPMRLSVYEKMQNTIEKQTSSHDTSILDFANVKYIISNNTLTGKNLKLVDVDNRVKLYKNMSYFPRVYFENKNGGAKLVEYNPEKIIIDVNVKKQDNLILADMFYPGWQVYVNEKKDKILPTKYYFREVNLLPGKYTVKFIYNPLSFRIGMFISLFTIIGIVSFFLINWRYENKIFQK